MGHNPTRQCGRLPITQKLFGDALRLPRASSQTARRGTPEYGWCAASQHEVSEAVWQLPELALWCPRDGAALHFPYRFHVRQVKDNSMQLAHVLGHVGREHPFLVNNLQTMTRDDADMRHYRRLSDSRHHVTLVLRGPVLAHLLVMQKFVVQGLLLGAQFLEGLRLDIPDFTRVYSLHFDQAPRQQTDSVHQERQRVLGVAVLKKLCTYDFHTGPAPRIVHKVPIMAQ